MIEQLKWFDWASIGLLYVLGVWKLVELCKLCGSRLEIYLQNRDKKMFEKFINSLKDAE